MKRAECNRIVFSSSATVYGEPRYLPCDEAHPLNPINPYGRTKLMGEELLRDWSRAGTGRCAVALRYFNPVGADASGEIGEDPRGVPNNLMPFVAQVALGRRAALQVFGHDYDTPYGTGVRDYIHVVDLALAHVAAVERLQVPEPFEAINVGRGAGISVLEIVRDFEAASGGPIKFEITSRREGDAAAVWADAKMAKEKFKFVAKLVAAQMCKDTLKWQSQNPTGFGNV